MYILNKSLVKECIFMKIIYDIKVDSKIYNNTCSNLFS